MSLTLTYNVSIDEGGKSLLKFLKRRQISKKTTVAIKHRGGTLLVNGSPQIVHYTLKEGDQVSIIFPEESISEGLTPFRLNLDIVYEDEYLMVLNKPAGIPTIPSIRYPSETLANGIIYYYSQKNISSTVHFVNRLDKDTSGLLVVAKYRHIHHLLTRELKQVKRKYYALVKGNLPKIKGTVNEPIAREQVGNVRRCIRKDGQPAITHYQLLEQWEGMNLVECELETGRTHQIRVHMQHLGCPLIGDTLYDSESDQVNSGQFLHSYHLSFLHPIFQELYTFDTAVPDNFLSLRKKMDEIIFR